MKSSHFPEAPRMLGGGSFGPRGTNRDLSGPTSIRTELGRPPSRLVPSFASTLVSRLLFSSTSIGARPWCEQLSSDTSLFSSPSLPVEELRRLSRRELEMI